MLRYRRWDLIFIAFFVLNLGFITYFFDIEQITVPDAVHMVHYPAWPPAPAAASTSRPKTMGNWSGQTTTW